MQRLVRRVLTAALVAVLALGAPSVAGAEPVLPPSTTVRPPNTDSCPQRSVPPSAVSTSERVAPGSSYPDPLPVPSRPVGGAALGACGFVLPAGAVPVPPDITARAWMVADVTSGSVLGGKDVHGRYRPASTIKLLTMLVMWRNLPDFGGTVVGTEEDARQEGSKAGIGAGGVYQIRDLILGLIMTSGNDCALALARANGGVEKTLAEMNSTAAGLGALDTRAATVSGLDAPGQQTSAYDLALITKAALNEPGFVEMMGTRTAMFPGHSQRRPFEIINDNKLLDGYPGALAGKTGFTDDARNTYVGVAERDGHRLVVTMLGGSQSPRRQWMQAASLLDWGFRAVRDGLKPVGWVVEPGTYVSEDESPIATTAPLTTGASGSAPTGSAGDSSNGTSSEQDAAGSGDADSAGSGLTWALLLLAAAGAAGIAVRRRRRGSVLGEIAAPRWRMRSRRTPSGPTSRGASGSRDVARRSARSSRATGSASANSATRSGSAREPQRRPRRTPLPPRTDL